MNNENNYKKAINQIHASDELKEKTLNRIKNNEKRRVPYMKYLAACAMFLVVFFIGANYINIEENLENNITLTPATTVEEKIAKVNKSNNDLPRFENMEQLKSVLKEYNKNTYLTNGMLELEEGVVTDSMATTESETKSTSLANTNRDYSTTNVQVENVDEADIVKTDGEYIYYVTNSTVYIVKADTLEIVSTISKNSETDIELFYPRELYINENKLIVLGNSSTRYQATTKKQLTTAEEIASAVIDTDGFVTKDVGYVSSKNTAKAIVYDITNKNNPVITREIELDGSYSNSRMIGENIYFISTKYAYYTNAMTDNEILPIWRDTAISDEINNVECKGIAYFENTESSSFTLVAGFNVNNNEEMFLETFFGASNTVYASENNLYLAQIKYENGWRDTKNTIYKFNLKDSQVILQCEAEVKGNLNNQFSLDEYDGNLRIATTSYNENNETINNLYVLDENLKEIGKIEGLAPGEKIYSVRFMGKVGYVVTFKQIDPLFVLDLSNPTNPVVKGELKIPGYSSYLHPYDETHIIGIGHNTRTTEYGSVTNAGLKMSMFDVSDLENPKEMFNVTIGEYYAHSDIEYNHKVLFSKTSENLIGFPVTYRDSQRENFKRSFIIFKIDLENGFEKYGEIINEDDKYIGTIQRAIYIDDTLYTLLYENIVAYDLNTLDKIKEVILKEE